MEDTPPPPPPPGLTSMDVPSMLSIMEGEGCDISLLRKCRGRTTVDRAYIFFCAFRESQSQALVAHSPSKEMATANDDASEKEEETAGGQYVFMLFTYFVEVINIVFGQSITKTCGCRRAKGSVRNEYCRVVNAVVVNIIHFYSVSKKNLPISPPKSQKLVLVLSQNKSFRTYITSHVAMLLTFLYQKFKKTGLPTKKTRATIGKTKGQPKNDEDYNPLA
jgi:hypothetical protein